MELTDCYEENNLRFCRSGDFYIVGTNGSKFQNGFVNPEKITSRIFIPAYVNGIPVREIGSSSLATSPIIENVIIEARINQINMYAFYRDFHLVQINIPNTCQFLFRSAINTADSDGIPPPNSYGLLNVFFEPNSKIRLIGHHALAYRAMVHISICDKVSVGTHTDTFKRSSVVIYSPFHFMIGKIPTTTTNFSSFCMMNKMTFTEKKRLIFKYCLVILFCM